MTDRTVRVIASDLDGTLLDAQHRLSSRTVSVLRAARRAGMFVVAATGRAPASAHPLVAPYGVVDALVCSNGSIIHDVESDATTHRFAIEPDHVDGLFEALDSALPGLSFCWEMDEHSAWDPGFDDIAARHDDLLRFGIGERPTGATRVTKVMVRHTELVREELADALLPHLPAPLTLGCSGVEFVEVTGVGVDKAAAVEHVVTQHGFTSADVVAFGDNHNDTQMLRWAGVGVAVENAVDTARQAADLSIGHHHDDAVADYVLGLL